MCTFIALTFPHTLDAAELAPVLDAFDMNGRAPGTRHDDERIYRATVGHCDCGTALGSEERVRRREGAHERERAKRRKMGWSEAKIARWEEERSRAEARAETRGESEWARAQAARGGSAALTRREEAARWVEFLTAALATRRTRHIGLLLHYGDLADERTEIRRRETLRIGDVTPEDLLRIEEDVLYRFSR